MAINRMRFAGSWYEDDPRALGATLDSARNAAVLPTGYGARRLPVGAVLPHAGLHFSARGMAPFFAALGASGGLDGVVILAPSHYMALSPDTFYVEQFGAHETPFGSLPGLPEVATALLAEAAGGTLHVRNAEAAIEAEHAVELFLPYLYRCCGARTRVAAALIGSVSSVVRAREMAKALHRAMTHAGLGRVGWIVSSDFTHYGTRFGHLPFGRGADVWERVENADRQIAEAAAAPSVDTLWKVIQAHPTTVCGRFPMLVGSVLAELFAARGTVVDYYTSAAVEHGTARVPPAPASDFVAYATVLYHTAGES